MLGPREATLRDMLHRGWCRTLYGKTTDHRMLLTRSFHKESFPRYSGYSREMAPIHDWYSSYIAKGSFHWQHGVRGHRWNGLMEGGWEKGGCLRKHSALYLILSFLSSITLPSPLLSLMTSLNVRL